MTTRAMIRALIKRPSRTSLVLLLYGFICYLIFVLATIPAQQVWQFVPQQNRVRLQTGYIQGTLWSGRIDSLQLNQLMLGQLQWDLNVLPLFIGRLDLDIKINGPLGQLQSNLAVSLDGSLQASNFSGEIPADSLNPYTLPATLDGAISLDIQKLIYLANQQLQLDGEILWRKASISVMQTMEIGEVRIISKAEDNGSILHITNKNSALGIEGSIKLSANGQYDLNIALLNRDNSRKDIRSLLQMLGKVDAAGKVYIKRQGRLRLQP